MRDPIRRWHVVDHFFAGAATLRRALDRRFDDARDPFDETRFGWERWHVHAQFSQLRAPARAIFGDATVAFEARLVSWAKKNLGLSKLGGPPWVSSLTDGDFQALHRDTPNGAFAFTYGLTKRSAKLRGGETLIANDELLDYWRSSAHAAREASSPMFDEIPSRFDRLVVFDSRIPHAVRAIEGPRHPRDGRVAIQGWLSADGVISEDAALGTRDANARGTACARAIPSRSLAGVRGMCSVRTEPSGARILASTLVAIDSRGDVSRAEAAIARSAKSAFRAKNATIPLVVDQSRARVAR